MSDGVWIPLLLTLKVAGWATLLALLMGVSAGFALARTRFPGRETLDAMLTLPMVLPPTVLGYYLLVLVGRRGVIGRWLDETFGITLIFTWQGAVLAAAITAPSQVKMCVLPYGSSRHRPFTPLRPTSTSR